VTREDDDDQDDDDDYDDDDDGDDDDDDDDDDDNNNTRRQKCFAKGSGKEVEIQEFMYRDTTNVEPELYDYTSNNWSHWNSNEKLKEKLFKRYQENIR